jgi:hypothetical protein
VAWFGEVANRLAAAGAAAAALEELRGALARLAE